MSAFAVHTATGSVTLVGRVPVSLAFTGGDDEFERACALSGPRIAKLGASRRGVWVTERIFPTLEEAVAAGRAVGIEVIAA